MKPPKGYPCLVCGRPGAQPVTLPSGLRVTICESCAGDRHMSAEAVRRAADNTKQNAEE